MARREAHVREQTFPLHGLDRLKRQPQIDNVRIAAQPPRRRPSAPLQNQANIAPQRVPRFDATVNIFVDE
ncbi:MAG: hypothetical protein WCB94_08445 [Terriglobales bacterium]